MFHFVFRKNVEFVTFVTLDDRRIDSDPAQAEILPERIVSARIRCTGLRIGDV
jgi:hypothetical protein